MNLSLPEYWMILKGRVAHLEKDYGDEARVGPATCATLLVNLEQLQRIIQSVKREVQAALDNFKADELTAAAKEEEKNEEEART